MKPIDFHPSAAQEAHDAAERYERLRPGLGDDFRGRRREGGVGGIGVGNAAQRNRDHVREDKEHPWLRDAEGPFLSAVAASPEDLAPRLIYSDWLEERGDSRGEYLRLRCDALQATEDTERQAKLRQAVKLARVIDLAWLRFIDLQDVLYRVAHRCGGGPLPLALPVLWREAVWRTNPRRPKKLHPDPNIAGVWEVRLEVGDEFRGCRDTYLENNPDRRRAFLAMFGQIDFLGLYNDRGDQFGLWRYANGVTAVEAPIISLDIGCQFRVVGRTLQDFFAVRWHEMLHRDDVDWDSDEREHFQAVQKWFAERKIATSPSLESIKESIKGLPAPQQRFERYCRPRK